MAIFRVSFKCLSCTCTCWGLLYNVYLAYQTLFMPRLCINNLFLEIGHLFQSVWTRKKIEKYDLKKSPGSEGSNPNRTHQGKPTLEIGGNLPLFPNNFPWFPQKTWIPAFPPPSSIREVSAELKEILGTFTVYFTDISLAFADFKTISFIFLITEFINHNTYIANLRYNRIYIYIYRTTHRADCLHNVMLVAASNILHLR